MITITQVERGKFGRVLKMESSTISLNRRGSVLPSYYGFDSLPHCVFNSSFGRETLTFTAATGKLGGGQGSSYWMSFRKSASMLERSVRADIRPIDATDRACDTSDSSSRDYVWASGW